MRITSLTLTNFRCFGANPETIKLTDLTALVGSNGCGKSTVLHALLRLFGTAQNERTLVREDFHLEPGADWEEVEEASLRIEAQIEFPELDKKSGLEDGVAACFKHMTIRGTGQAPYCRVRLGGKWARSNVPEGEIEQKLLWVTSPLGTLESDEKTQSVQGHERSRIHVHYVPASRDPSRQIKLVSGSLLHTLLRAVEWSNVSKTEIENASEAIREAFAGEQGVQVIQSAIEECWKELHDAPAHRQVAIRPVARRLVDVIRQVEASFSPGLVDDQDCVERLSDGQKSLFYLALVAALFDVQEAVGDSEQESISRKQLSPPILNVLAVEEPENHVAPHYLGRIMSVMRRVGEAQRGQVVLSSHSASLLARVEPEQVRHLRLSMPERTTVIRGITLPDEKSEQHKFVREAVRAYPELYFARVVVLGEGDSEEIVVPRLASAMDVPLDTNAVCVVPLGGRHVNHFWRLLGQLEIPYVTLLDLDRERHGGGWGRIKYAVKQLLGAGVSSEELLAITDTNGKSSVLSKKDLDEMHRWPVDDKENMQAWIASLETYGVYFSAPLDLDFMMLRSFPVAYKGVATASEGPEVPKDEASYSDALARVLSAVLGDADEAGKTYNKDEQEALFWYRYLFLGRSKPSTHILALANVEKSELKARGPQVVARMIDQVKRALAADESGPPDEE